MKYLILFVVSSVLLIVTPDANKKMWLAEAIHHNDGRQYLTAKVVNCRTKEDARVIFDRYILSSKYKNHHFDTFPSGDKYLIREIKPEYILK